MFSYSNDDARVATALVACLNAATRLMIAKAIHQEKTNKVDRRT